MRVLVGSTAFFPWEGGAERQGRLLASALRRVGVEVEYVAARLPGSPRGEIVDGVPVHRLWAGPPGLPGRFRPAVFYFRLREFLRREGRRFDVWQAQGAFDVVAPAMTDVRGDGNPAKVIRYASRNEWQRLRAVPCLPSRLAARLTLADCHVANSQRTLAVMTGEYGLPPARCRVVPNMVAPMSRAATADARARLGWPLGPPVVLCISNFHPGKNQRRLIEAWPLVLSKYREARLVLVGDGVELQHCRLAVRTLQLTGSVVFTGRVTDPLVYLAAADVFAFPSGQEGQSNALLEAMAAGMAIAVADCADNRETIEPGRDALSFAPDPVAVADAVATLIGDRGMAGRLGAAARTRAMDEHNPERVAKSYLEIYGEVHG
jgi:glycosyltransferase involved in cell wall biosynthesis